MRESVIYQEILREGELKGRQVGRQEGRQEGEQLIVLRLLNRQVGPLSEATVAQITSLSLDALEHLSEALLDFNTQTDLQSWLQNH